MSVTHVPGWSFPWHAPQDVAAWGALGLAVAVLVAWPWVATRGRDRLFVAGAAVASAVLSAGYVVYYLRGGPRVIDATTYYLQARALSEGLLAWSPAGEASEVAGRFLLTRDTLDGVVVSGLFPPGYPAVLALGFLVGAPLAVGPLLGALTTYGTYDLARQALASEPRWRDVAPRVASALAVTSAALRYHTADTMSHGLSAVCFTFGLSWALRASSATGTWRWAALSGLAVGWLCATRPVSGAAAVALLVALALTAWPRARRRWLGLSALGALPGIALLVLHQWAATGDPLASTQRFYYAQADGPPGCFAYGFGERVGCLVEHGDFVAEYLPGGYGAVEALGTTGRRLIMHLPDALNVELGAVLLVVGAVVGFRAGRLRWLVLGLGLQLVAYVPFYFDGNVPGAGARMYADVLPLELVVITVGGLWLSERGFGATPRTLRFGGAALLAVSALGFSIRQGRDHAWLRDREGGAPMFPSELPPALVEGAGTSLVFVGTDHGFNLGHDPAPPSAPRVDVVRGHGDSLDVLAWERRGRPPAYLYRFDPRTGEAGWEQWTPTPESLDHPSIEGESLWPAVTQSHGWVTVEHDAGACASHGGRLRLMAEAGAAHVSADLRLPRALAGASVQPEVWVEGSFEAARVELWGDGALLHGWSLGPASGPRCWADDPFIVPESLMNLAMRLVVEGPTAGSRLALDRITVGKKPFDP